jgi:hypothetical protein
MASASMPCRQAMSGVLSFKMTDLIDLGWIEVEVPLHSFQISFELKPDKIFGGLCLCLRMLA